MQIQQGDLVVYGIHGVCRVSDIETRRIDQKSVDYYVLTPINQADANFFVPMHNPLAVAIMRKVLTRDVLIALLESEEVKKDSWIPNETQRKEKYRQRRRILPCQGAGKSAPVQSFQTNAYYTPQIFNLLLY